MNLQDFLVWLSTGGALIAASWLLGQIPGYDALSEKLRQWIFFGLSLVFAGGAVAINTYVSADVLAKIAPWFLIVAFVFSAIFIQKAYMKLVEVAKSIKILSAKK